MVPTSSAGTRLPYLCLSRDRPTDRFHSPLRDCSQPCRSVPDCGSPHRPDVSLALGKADLSSVAQVQTASAAHSQTTQPHAARVAMSGLPPQASRDQAGTSSWSCQSQRLIRPFHDVRQRQEDEPEKCDQQRLKLLPRRPAASLAVRLGRRWSRRPRFVRHATSSAGDFVAAD